MKRFSSLLFFGLFLATLSLSVNSCAESTTDANITMENADYICPMRCEGGFSNDKAAKCPACGMDLMARADVEAIEKENAEAGDGHNHEHDHGGEEHNHEHDHEGGEEHNHDHGDGDGHDHGDHEGHDHN